MRAVPLSPVRRLLLAWFDHRRVSPYISLTVSIDFGVSGAYLARLRAEGGARVSVQALLIAAIGRLYRDFPDANCRIIGDRIFRAPHVGVAAPVNLIGHEGEDKLPLSMMVIEAVDTLSLLQVAERNTRIKEAERGGRPQNPFVRSMLDLSGRAPIPALQRSIGLMHRFYDNPSLAPLSWRVTPATVGISNVGATHQVPQGLYLRGAAINLPTRPVHVGSLFGVSAVQEEVVPHGGVPAVRPMLPVLYVFDHRLFDGYLASRIVTRFAEILQDPAAEFGPSGDQVRR